MKEWKFKLCGHASVKLWAKRQESQLWQTWHKNLYFHITNTQLCYSIITKFKYYPVFIGHKTLLTSNTSLLRFWTSGSWDITWKAISWGSAPETSFMNRNIHISFISMIDIYQFSWLSIMCLILKEKGDNKWNKDTDRN